MKRLGLALFLCLVSLLLPAVSRLPQASRAQDSAILADLEISLWPEYDRPDVLVIYHGQVEPVAGASEATGASAADAFPFPITLSIPASVGAPSAVAYVTADGGRFNLQYTTAVQGDRLLVSFDLPTPDFQLEYYDDLPVSDGGVREYTFTYTADYAVRDLVIELQEPPLAQDVALDPAADSSSVAADGLRYDALDAGSLEPGESQSWTFRYTKQDDRLTAAFFEQASPSPAPTQAAAPAGSGSPAALFVVAFVALAGVGVAAYWLGQRTQAPAPRKAPPPARRKRDRDGQDAAGAYFCHNCGAEIRGDAHFCNACGAAVRRE